MVLPRAEMGKVDLRSKADEAVRDNFLKIKYTGEVLNWENFVAIKR